MPRAIVILSRYQQFATDQKSLATLDKSVWKDYDEKLGQICSD